VFTPFLRHHSRYLAPTKELNILSVLAVLIRSLLVSAVIYFSFFVFLLSVLGLVGQIPFFRNKTDGLIYEWIKTDIFKLSNDEKKPESQPEPDANSNNARNTTSKTAKNTTANQGKKATLIFQYENEEIKLKDIDLENITDKATDSGKTEGSKTQENSRVQWKDRALFRVAIYWMFILLLIIATLAVVAFIQYCRLTTSKIGESFYCWRTNSQQTQGTFLIIFLLSIILLTIPIVHAYLQEALQNQLETVGFVGLISGVWAALAKLRQFMGKGDVFKTPWIGNLLFRAGAFLFIYALIIVAYDISVHIAPTTVSEPISWGKVLIAFFIFLVIFVAASYFFNINDSTVASMYRDRLMETFLPDTEAVKEKRWKKAIKANTVKLEKMCKKEKADKKI